jgi:hypothetical protein
LEVSPAKSFIAAWFAENYYFQGYPAPWGKCDPQSEVIAHDCFSAAVEAGISPQEITEEIGNLTGIYAQRFGARCGRICQ